ncbi:tRNA pseudouridine38-40 synthase [Desulfohalotomaculum tongense]|uniref:tRNA pseudouridine(38-40) synthase TruA n=1 Tax=Desulforadius tongensis TaxID=1216062 RepID=UPI001958BD59|nr:tRNA pseudouridine(38-40) synthase TruA [Desulforadius tongensis]MBM7853859.1 tRNA pseudouridine38-40 synthase [Desulforadius tongensis]
MNIKLTVAYDGTNYHGFQEQRGTKYVTIQELLEKSLSKLAKQRIQVIGAGRTDSGVHARGQVVNFKCDSWPVPLNKVPLAVNALLPGDVVVLKAEEVPADFHARFSALGKTYTYTIYNHPLPDPFSRRFALHEPRPLDDKAMNEAAQFLVGKHDFKSFQAQGTPVKTTVREITAAGVKRERDYLYLKFTANGFLYNMVRIMTGTLIQVGLGKIKPADVKTILESKDRTKAGPTAPPQGLCMDEIYY